MLAIHLWCGASALAATGHPLFCPAHARLRNWDSSIFSRTHTYSSFHFSADLFQTNRQNHLRVNISLGCAKYSLTMVSSSFHYTICSHFYLSLLCCHFSLPDFIRTERSVDTWVQVMDVLVSVFFWMLPPESSQLVLSGPQRGAASNETRRRRVQRRNRQRPPQ